MSRPALLSLLISTVAAMPAMAQDTATTPPQDDSGMIVVTAQRRAESVQDVPISVSVVSNAQLDRQQVTQLSDLSRTSASVQFGSVGGSGGGGGGGFIRGIGTASLSRSAESAVGIVVDGVVQGNTNVNNLFDVSRVEILRGPQGTLFGQSVSAGVINISTIAPDPSKVSGKIAIDLSANGFAGSEYGRQIIRGAVNVPVSGESAIRFSAYGGGTKGILRNTVLDRNDSFQENGFRGRFMGKFGEKLTFNLIADYNYSSGRDGQFFTYIRALSPALTNVLASCGIIARPGNLEHCSSPIELQQSRSYGGSAQFDIELGGLTLTSITALRKNNLYATGDIDRLNDTLNPGVDVHSGSKTKYQQFTQEVRLASDPNDPLSFTVGGFYYDADTEAEDSPAFGSTVSLPNGFILSTPVRNVSESKNISGFGEARYEAGPFTAFAGARLTRSELSLAGRRQSITLIGPIPNGALLTNDYGYEDTDISWRVGGQFRPSRELMVYGTVARGYKNAQLTPIIALSTGPILERVIQPEKPMSYELGLKSSLLDGRLAVNVSGFYQKVSNLQAQTFVTLADVPQPTLLPTNVSKVISKGIEADIFGRIGDNFTINASAIYNVAKYPSDYTDQAGVSLEGKQIAFAPRLAGTISGEYVIPLSGSIDGFLSLDARYRSKTRLSDVRRASDLTVDQSRWIFGGRVGARVDDSWSVAVFANNVGASRIPGVYNLLLGNLAAFYSAQSLRQVGLQAQLDF